VSALWQLPATEIARLIRTGQAYAEAMANRALASFSWQDTVNLWLSRKFHAQRLKATALGMLTIDGF
jgi:hypothetical protein